MSKLAPVPPCGAVLVLDHGNQQCIHLLGPNNHRMHRDDRTQLRLPHPIHTSELGHQWLASGRVLFNPDEDKP